MKCFVVFCIILFAAVAYVKAKDELKEEYCSEEMKKTAGPCGKVKCNENNTEVSGIACPLFNCQGDILRVEKEDPSKPFPECCEKIICKE